MKRIILSVFSISLSFVAMAQNSDVLKVKEARLSNGMTVWLNEDHSQPKVYGAVVVKAGAKDCPNTGIAHYFEHIKPRNLGSTRFRLNTTNWLPPRMKPPDWRFRKISAD